MENRHFTLIIAGDNPDDMVRKYDNKLLCGKTLVYEFSKAKEYHDKYKKVYKALSESGEPEEMEKAKNLYDFYNSLDDTDFYIELTSDLDIDDETGDAYTNKNIDGKYDVCRIGNHLSLPLIDKKGNETFSGRKCDIDWSRIHLNNKETYEFVWDAVMEGKKPETDDEKKLYENMKNRKVYFTKFGTRENYVVSNTAFWGFAFLDNNGWVELEDTKDQFEWVSEFYDRFIKPLPDNTLISVYECIRY